jgi:hypothetical protein
LYGSDAFTSEQTNFVGDLIFAALDNQQFVTEFLQTFAVDKENVLEFIETIATAVFVLSTGDSFYERRQFQHSVVWLAICLRVAFEAGIQDERIRDAMKLYQHI